MGEDRPVKNTPNIARFLAEVKMILAPYDLAVLLLPPILGLCYP